MRANNGIAESLVKPSCVTFAVLLFALASCRDTPVDFTPSVLWLQGRVLRADRTPIPGMRVDAGVQIPDCAGPQTAGGFHQPNPVTDANGRFALLLQAVDAPGPRCLTVLTWPVDGGDSTIAVFPNMLFKWPPIDTLDIELVMDDAPSAPRRSR